MASNMSAAQKKKLLDKVMGDINKKAGRTVIGTVNNPDMADLVRIDTLPTPSIELNVALGGGLPRGKIVELMGENSSGKTSLAIETMALDMKENPDSIWAWYETEGSVDLDYMNQFEGFDASRLVVWHMEDEGAEKGLDFLEAMLRTGQFTGVVINSVAGLTPAREMESEMAKQDIALQARMMSKLMRKVTAVASKSKTLMLFINQFRSNVGGYGNPDVSTGGRALSFYATQRIAMRKVKVEKADGITEEEGIKVSCRISKNRISRDNPYKAAKYIALFGKGIDRIRGLAEMAVDNEVVEQSGSWLYYPNKSSIATLPDGNLAKWQSFAKFLDYIKENPDFFLEIKDILENKSKSGAVKVNYLDEEEVNEIKQQDASIESDEDINIEDEQD